MSQINPKEIRDRGIIVFAPETEIQQVGIDLTLEQGIHILHGMSVNINFQETIKLPADVYSTFVQRSSYSRKGIFMTTGVYDPGYEGSIGCTIYNMSGFELVVERGERVGQMLFFEAKSASTYDGQWQNK